MRIFIASLVMLVLSILDWSQAAGKATGIVTSTRITHATPAAAYAHSADRNWENDYDQTEVAEGIAPEYNNLFNCKDIARQLVEDNQDINVILGGGRRNFRTRGYTAINDTVNYRRRDGRDLIVEWIEGHNNLSNTNSFVQNKPQLDAVDPLNTDYLLGLFSSSHLPYEALRDSEMDPTLAQLTRKAVQILSKDEDGFFLLVEGGRIDHAHHDSKARLALDETYAMDEAVRVVMEMTSAHDTLVVVTADHSHAFTSGGYTTRGNDILGLADNVPDRYRPDSMPFTTLLYGNGPGGVLPTESRENLTDVDTQDVEYVQQAAVLLTEETHGGEDVPIYASGPMAHLFHGVHEQNYIAHVMAYASCVGANKKHCSELKITTIDHGNKSPSITSGSCLLVFSLVMYWLFILSE